MNERTDPNSAHSADADIRRLLEQAGPRPRVPEDVMTRLKAGAREAWRARSDTSRAPGSRPAAWMALAATVLLTLSLAWLWKVQSTPTATGEPVALLELVRGSLQLDSGGGTVAGTPIAAGGRVETGPGVADGGAVRLASGHSLRLDRATRVQLVAADRIRLVSGAVYLDSGPGGADVPVAVMTPFGTVRDIGTQFEVRLPDDGADGAASGAVRVREGRVELTFGGDSLAAAAGDELRLFEDGRVERTTIEADGDFWQWAQRVAPPFETDGATLGEFFDWFSRETGMRVGYVDGDLEVAAPAITLSGSIGGLTPFEALGVVVPAAGFRWDATDGRVTIDRVATSAP